MHKVFIGIGGNIGDKQKNFTRVRPLINQRLGKILKESSIYETPPWGFHSEFKFWNQAMYIETTLETEEMLWRIKEIEAMFGRNMEENSTYDNREMDIDILYFDDIFYDSKELVIPHRRLHERLFVLVPLVEIAPEFKHPLLRMTNLTLLENCRDKSIIRKVNLDENPEE